MSEQQPRTILPFTGSPVRSDRTGIRSKRHIKAFRREHQHQHRWELTAEQQKQLMQDVLRALKAPILNHIVETEFVEEVREKHGFSFMDMILIAYPDMATIYGIPAKSKEEFDRAQHLCAKDPRIGALFGMINTCFAEETDYVTAYLEHFLSPNPTHYAELKEARDDLVQGYRSLGFNEISAKMTLRDLNASIATVLTEKGFTQRRYS